MLIKPLLSFFVYIQRPSPVSRLKSRRDDTIL